MRTVLPSSQVAHLWAHQSQARARNSSDSFSFSGRVLFSYATPIAALVEGSAERVVLITTETYSVTTSGKHMPPLRAAVRHMKTFTVPYLGAEACGGYYRVPETAYRNPGMGHATNLAHLIDNYNTRVTRYLRMRDLYRDEAAVLDDLSELAHDAIEYARLFSLSLPAFDCATDAREIMRKREKREARNNAPGAAEKRQRERAQRAERKARKEEEARRLALQTAEEAIAGWRAGGSLSPQFYSYPPLREGAMLRIRGDIVQTSMGAEVPLHHAVRVYPFVKLIKERGEPWQRNGQRVPIGQFQLDRIASNGDIHAGCHFIRWDEIERFARDAGIANAAPDDVAVIDATHA